jgi:hypothetical protein
MRLINNREYWRRKMRKLGISVYPEHASLEENKKYIELAAKYGNTTYGSDGSSYTKYGNTTYGSDGSSYTKYGNTTYGSDGSSYTNYGNSVYGR